MRKTIVLLALLIAGCSGGFTQAGLVHEAERAVAARLDHRGTLTFENVRGVMATHMACGHVVVRDAVGRTVDEQDFVYADRHAWFDDEPLFASAAISCDDADGDDGNAS